VVSVKKVVIIAFTLTLILEILFKGTLLQVAIGQPIKQQVRSQLFIFITSQVSLCRLDFTEPQRRQLIYRKIFTRSIACCSASVTTISSPSGSILSSTYSLSSSPPCIINCSNYSGCWAIIWIYFMTYVVKLWWTLSQLLQDWLNCLRIAP
jgi:hypothetical protein